MVNPTIRVGKMFKKELEEFKKGLKGTVFEDSSTPRVTDLFARDFADYKTGVKRAKKRVKRK